MVMNNYSFFRGMHKLLLLCILPHLVQTRINSCIERVGLIPELDFVTIQPSSLGICEQIQGPSVQLVSRNAGSLNRPLTAGGEVLSDVQNCVPNSADRDIANLQSGISRLGSVLQQVSHGILHGVWYKRRNACPAQTYRTVLQMGGGAIY